MGRFPQSFDVYGFTIEVHAGGRRVWPPNFKRFIKDKLDQGKLTVGEVMRECNVSQSLVYKWRADVKRAGVRATTLHEKRFFSEVLVEETATKDVCYEDEPDSLIHLSGREIEISLPGAYPVDDLVKVILAMEDRA